MDFRQNDNDWKEFLGVEQKAVVKTAVRQIIKRDGTTEKYDRWKIASAIGRAIHAARGHEDLDLVERLTAKVELALTDFMSSRHPNSAPAIEEIQDIVETILVESGEVEIAKAYIIYRARHEVMRDTRKLMLDINGTMDGYLQQSDWRVNEKRQCKLLSGRFDSS